MTIQNKKFIIKFHYFILFIASFLFFVGGPAYDVVRSLKALWNLGHVLFFFLFVLTIVKSNVRLQNLSSWKLLGLLLGITIFISVCTEGIQSVIKREMDFGDIRKNILGCMIGFVFVRRKVFFISKHIAMIITVLIIFLSYESIPLYKGVYDDIVSYHSFPILSDFESRYEIDRFEGDSATIMIDNVHSKNGNRALKILLGTAQYSGVSCDYFPRDWTNFNTFCFSVFNNGIDPIRLHFRVHDKQHVINDMPYSDRYNTVLKINPG